MIRFFDLIFSFFGSLLLFPVGLLLYLIGLFDTGAPLFKQERVGKHKKPFILYKFRTMDIHTKSMATHLASQNSVTKFGSFLRKTKLDELPQLVNVLKGDMSLVGARPCLYNQVELIEEREKREVYNYLPGITGLAQINGVDMSKPLKLAEIDAKMLKHLSLKDYFVYIFATVWGKGRGDRIGD
jgi:O-antigen biosynthesis protein WbqP